MSARACAGDVGGYCALHGSWMHGAVVCPICATRQPTFFDAPQPATYDGKADGPRLTGLLEAVRALMSDQQWRTLAQIVAVVGHSEAGVSARLRELRRRHAGSHVVERKRIGDPKRGLWAYQLVS